MHKDSDIYSFLREGKSLRKSLAAAVLIGVLAPVALAAVALDGNQVAAKPAFGSNCASCHGVANPTAAPGKRPAAPASSGGRLGLNKDLALPGSMLAPPPARAAIPTLTILGSKPGTLRCSSLPIRLAPSSWAISPPTSTSNGKTSAT